MITCPSKKVVQDRLRNTDDTFQTSYGRSYYYETPVTRPLYRARVKEAVPENLRVQKSFSDYYVSVYDKEHDAKFIGYRAERYGRSGARLPSLKNLHEKYVNHLIKPLKPGLTTTGLTYIPPKKLFEPFPLPYSSPVNDATCSISVIGKKEFSPIPTNEPSAYKHLDIFGCTSHFQHVNFTTEQRNGLSKNNLITYYNTTLPQCRSQDIPQIGPYFPRCGDIVPDPVYPNTFRPVPYKANNSTYKADYGHISQFPILWKPNVRFPLVFKLSRNEVLVTPAMYYTEQGHVGSGNQSSVL